MKAINTPLIRLVLVLVSGILTGFYLEFQIATVAVILGLAAFLFSLAFLRSRRLFLQDALFGSSSYLLFFSIGLFTTSVHLPENQPRHYLHQMEEQATPGEFLIRAIIQEQLKPDLYNEKFIGRLERLDGKVVQGKVLLLFQKEEELQKEKQLQIGVDDELLLSATLTPIAVPLNPHQFDYNSFMANRGIFHQARVEEESIRKLNGNRRSLRGMANDLRNSIITKLRASEFEPEALSIVQALLLGQRRDISAETYDNYAAAGVIHILAVSGLHVGIILLILNRLFSPLLHLKHGKTYRVVILLISLWGFAVIAGLSPSVVRAVCMFSFLCLAMQLRRRTNALNTLFMSMLLLLLIRPQNLFEVGFQLSYLAVISIVLLQPLLYNLWQPKNVLLKYIWGLSTVTLAAQAGVFPLSLYYFHQFPGLFFISNLVILPFLGIILFLGICVILLALLDLLPKLLLEGYGLMIESLNSFVAWVAQQENWIFTDIPFTLFQMLGFYLLLMVLIALFKNFGARTIRMALTAVLLLQLLFFYENFQNRAPELVVFHKSRHTILGEKSAKTFKLRHNLKRNFREEAVIRNYMMGKRIEEVQDAKLENIYSVNNRLLLVIDSLGIYSLPEFRPHYILLVNSPRINLDRLLMNSGPVEIIADGSNYKSFVQRWQQTCSKKNIPFHYTGTKGAYIFGRTEKD